MATISSPGIGSSKFDLSGLLIQLEQYESQPLAVIKAAQASTQTTITAYGTLTSAVTAVQNASAKLARAETFGATKPAVTGTGLTATTKAGATPGQYSIEVKELATRHVLKSESLNRTDANGAGGDITIALANDKSHTVKLGSDTSLNGIAKAINADDKAGVTATIVNDGKGGSHLLLTAKGSGEKNAVTSINVANNDDLAAKIGFGPATPDADGNAGAIQSALSVQTEAKNAALIVNGIEVTSGSNTVTDVLDGVTLTLTEKTTTPVTLTLTTDNSAALSAANEFVTAYNSLQSTIKALTSYDVASNRGSSLTADSTTRAVQDSLASALRFSSSEGDLRSLGQIGITTDPKTGNLVVDQTKLTASITASPADVARIFTGENGLNERVSAATKTILGDGTRLKGSISTRTEALEKQAKAQLDSYEAAERRIASTMATYEAQFTALSKSLAMFESTQDYLTTQFDLMKPKK